MGGDMSELDALRLENRQLREEIALLKADQGDWRNGVALIASSLGDPGDNLSCSRLAEVALTQRAEVEQLREALTTQTDLLRRERAEHQEVAQRLLWQPMDTAPTDGMSVVLLRESGHAPVVAHFMPGGYCVEDHPAIARGWYYDGGRKMFEFVDKPLAWSPLPGGVIRETGSINPDGGVGKAGKISQ